MVGMYVRVKGEGHPIKNESFISGSVWGTELNGHSRRCMR